MAQSYNLDQVKSMLGSQGFTLDVGANLDPNVLFLASQSKVLEAGDYRRVAGGAIINIRTGQGVPLGGGDVQVGLAPNYQSLVEQRRAEQGIVLAGQQDVNAQLAAQGLIRTDAGVTTAAIQGAPPPTGAFIGQPMPKTGATTSPAGLYTVVAGDSLSKIAARNGLTLDQLLTANPQFKQPGRSIDLIYPGEKVNLPGKGGTTPAQSPTPPPPPAPPGTPTNLSTGSGATSVSGFIKDLLTTTNALAGIDVARTEREGLQKQVQDFFTQKKSSESILEEELKRFGVSEEMTIRKELDKTVLEQTQRLRKMPESIRQSLEDVGVTQAQLDRIVTRDMQKPAEVLRDLLEQRGVLSTSINESMAFVKLFAGTRMEDEATKLEALKYELEFNEGELKDLEDDKKFILNAAIEDRKDIMKYVLEAMQNNAPSDVITKALASGDSVTALSILGKYATDEKLETSYQDIGPNRVLIVTNSKGKVVSQTILGLSGTTSSSKPLSGLEIQNIAEADFLVGNKLQAGMTMDDVKRISTEVHAPRKWEDKELKTLFQTFKDGQVTESQLMTQIYSESAFLNKDDAVRAAKQVYGTYTGEEEAIDNAKKYWIGDGEGTGLSGVAPSPGTQKSPSAQFGVIDISKFKSDNVYFPSTFQLGDE